MTKTFNHYEFKFEGEPYFIFGYAHAKKYTWDGDHENQSEVDFEVTELEDIEIKFYNEKDELKLVRDSNVTKTIKEDLFESLTEQDFQ